MIEGKRRTRTTTFKMTFTLEDETSVTIKKENGRIVAFSVNYRTKIDDKWYDVIRYDTAHGMIHVHKFLRSPELRRLRRGLGELTHENMKMAIIEATKDIKSNWERYKRYLTEKVRGNENKNGR